MTYLQECGKQGNSMTYYSETTTPYITITQKEDGQKIAFSFPPKKGDHRIVKNYKA